MVSTTPNNDAGSATPEQSLEPGFVFPVSEPRPKTGQTAVLALDPEQVGTLEAALSQFASTADSRIARAVQVRLESYLDGFERLECRRVSLSLDVADWTMAALATVSVAGDGEVSSQSPDVDADVGTHLLLALSVLAPDAFASLAAS